MKAAAAARRNWARRRTGGLRRVAVPGRSVARIATVLLSLFALVVIGCAAVGLAVTLRSDMRQADARHIALETALDEFHAVFGDLDRFEDGQLRLIAQRAGLDGLRFDGDLTAEPGREVQSVHDAQGRIVGWLSWTPDRALIVAMEWYWSVVGAVALAHLACALLTLWSTRRLLNAVTTSYATIRRLTTQDLLTGLPIRRVSPVATLRNWFDFLAGSAYGCRLQVRRRCRHPHVENGAT